MNFKTLIITCTHFGGKYNPINSVINLSGLNALEAAEAAINDLKNALPDCEKAVSQCEAAFAALSALVRSDGRRRSPTR